MYLKKQNKKVVGALPKHIERVIFKARKTFGRSFDDLTGEERQSARQKAQEILGSESITEKKACLGSVISDQKTLRKLGLIPQHGIAAE